MTSCIRRGIHAIDDRARRAEVARRYAWARRDKSRDREPWSPAKQLSADLATVYRDHWGELDDDKEGRGLFAILLHTLAHRPAFEKLAVAARAEFAPWLPDDAFECIADEAIRLKRKWKADTLAQRLGLTYADQQRLGVWRFIGAVDVPKAERDRRRSERRNANRKAKNRAAGVKPRPEYEANAKADRAEAKALGISYEAFRKRKQRAAKKACPKSGTITKKEPFSGTILGTPKRAAPPKAFQAGMSLGTAFTSSSWQQSAMAPKRPVFVLGQRPPPRPFLLLQTERARP